MQTPLQITFKDMKRSEALANQVRENVAWLEKFWPQIISCRVVIRGVHQRHHTGSLFYEIGISLRVPGKEIAVSQNPKEAKQHHDVQVSIRDAFEAARSELENYARVVRREGKHREASPHAKVVLLRRDSGFGFIETDEGRELYFHSNSVLHGDFERLQVGTLVRFSEEAGEQGPQASTIEVIGGRRSAA